MAYIWKFCWRYSHFTRQVLRTINEICFPFRNILCSLVYNFTDRSSHQRCSVIKGVLRNFAKFIGKHLCQSLFFNKVADLEPCNFIKKETLAQVFSCAYCEISKNTFLSKHVFFPVAPSVLMFQNRELPSFIIHYLYALKRLIKAERTSNWSLHIESTNIKQVKCICFVWSYQLCQTRKNVLSAYAKYYWAVSLVVQNVCPYFAWSQAFR